MASLKQADRLMQFTSPLGKDVLLIESIDGAEGISRLFEYRVDLLATVDTNIDPKDLIGAKVSVALNLNDAQGSRYINGIVASFEQRAGDSEFYVYRARIVPAMWQLTLSANCRVFQNKTVLDIAKAVIGEYGLSISDQTSGSYKQLEYCTQYSETDFNFVSRILEESGIYYFFEHSDQDNKIVLGDSRNAYQDCALSASVPYALNQKGAEGAYGAVVTEFNSVATMVSGMHSTSDYTHINFARSDAPVKDSTSPYGKNAFDQYLYPAGVEGYANDATQTTTDLEKLIIETRQLASDATAEVLRGKSNARSLCAGYTFSLTDHPRSAWNRKYLLTEVSFRTDQVPPYRASDVRKGREYSNRFSAVSSDITFKPALTIAKPKIYGPQTATVVGPSGEEIYLDKYGRVKVQFFWDKLDDKGSTTNTTWVRVAQSWAGNGWGTYYWPRVNDEVVVEFLNGDPDNPVVVGSVYNAKNMPKYALPDNGTRSGIVTRSSKGGSGANCNELRFEDKKGSEQIYIHAEKDMDVSIEHDRVIVVGNNDSLTVKQNQTEQVGGDFNRQVKGNTVEKVGGNSDVNIGGNRTESVGGNQSLKVGGNQTESVGGNHGLNVSGNQAISVGSAYSLNSNNTIYINGGMSVVIQAGMELSLVASGNFVTIGPSGVSISGTMVLINSGGAAGSGSAGDTGSPGSPASPSDPDTVDDDDSGGSNAGGAGGSSTSAGGAAGAGGPTTFSGQKAQPAADAARQAAEQAQKDAQQATLEAQRAANQVMQQARQTFQQAQQAVQQAQQAVGQAVGPGKAIAQQTLSQAEQQAQLCAQAGAQSAKAAQEAAKQIRRQAELAAEQAQQAAKEAEQQAQKTEELAKAAKGSVDPAAHGAVEQASQAAWQAAAQAQQAAVQAQQQMYQAGHQVGQAAGPAEQQAQQAGQAAQQSAQNAISQAGQDF
jgi:type VI secretion system secreted protein VgrG